MEHNLFYSPSMRTLNLVPYSIIVDGTCVCQIINKNRVFYSFGAINTCPISVPH